MTRIAEGESPLLPAIGAERGRRNGFLFVIDDRREPPDEIEIVLCDLEGALAPGVAAG
jgi:hypothetical protein